MKRTHYLVVYFTRKGATFEMAQEIAATLSQEESAVVVVVPSFEVDAQQILACDGLFIGSPCYFDSYAGAIQDLFERTYEAIEDRVAGKLVCLFIAAGDDPKPACVALTRLVQKIGLSVFSEAILRISGDPIELWKARCRDVARAFHRVVGELSDKSGSNEDR